MLNTATCIHLVCFLHVQEDISSSGDHEIHNFFLSYPRKKTAIWVKIYLSVSEGV